LSQEQKQKPQVHKLGAAPIQAKFQQGVELHQQGRLAHAERIYREVLQHQPNHFGALHMLGAIALDTGHAEQGADLIRKAIGLNANVAAAHSNLGKALLDLKHPLDALASFDHAILLEPEFAMAHNNRGNALLDLKRPEEALASCEKAIALNPAFAEAYNNCGLALANLKRPEEALASCDKAIALKPDFAEAHNNRGNALIALNCYEQALASYDNAIALMPNYAMAHHNRGVALQELNRYDETFAAFDKAFALDPDIAGAEGDRLHAKMRLCDWTTLNSECTHLISSVREGHVTTPPFELLPIPSPAAEQLRCARLWVESRFPPSKVSAWKTFQYNHHKIRVAYLSADFRNHAVSLLLAGVFEQHDRKRFETIAISFGPQVPSEMLTRLKASFDQFIDVRNRSDFDVARLLQTLEVDIAVDLMGYTANSRTAIFALRPSAIQVNFLGYPGTMGADCIDYLIADQTLIPVCDQQYYSEKIAYLPNTYMPNDSKRPVSGRIFHRADFGLPQSGFVFCCFNNSYKLNPHIFDRWMRTLKKVQGSVLWLSENNATAATNLRKEAEIRGINPNRLIFAKRMESIDDHLGRHSLADLFLDTLPFNAHTTASDALWAGLPVLTQIGETFAGRVAASLLNAINLPELITSTSEAYEDAAVALAIKPEKLTAIKHRLANNRLTTPLFDTKLFTKHIEAAYTSMYERHHADLLPDHIYVPA
jgi:protein O-GlcNAc transferase